MIHVEETVTLDLGRELEFGQFELGKKTEGWKWLEQSHRRGKRASGLRFPNPNWTWIYVARKEDSGGETGKEGNLLSDNIGCLTHG